jgi:hypothetical protein
VDDQELKWQFGVLCRDMNTVSTRWDSYSVAEKLAIMGGAEDRLKQLKHILSKENWQRIARIS